MPDLEHILCSENQDQLAKREVAMQILGATVNRAVRILGDFEFCFRTDPESDQAYTASLEVENLDSKERDFVVPRRVGPDGRVPRSIV